MKYIVSKGWEGFCDRMQCLSECMTIAVKYNRALIVDWQDTIWHHGFYRYFRLEGIQEPNVDEMPAAIKVYPEFWEHAVAKPSGDWIYKLRDVLTFDVAKADAYADMWIHPGIGLRTYNFGTVVRHMRMQDEVREYVEKTTEGLPDLPVVHLRGTDRKFEEEAWEKLVAEVPEAVVVSDDITLVKRWMEASPKSYVLTKTAIEAKQGGHRMNEQQISKFGLNKHQMNLELLRDFFVLARAKEAHGLNGDSLFFKMSRILGGCEKSLLTKV